MKNFQSNVTRMHLEAKNSGLDLLGITMLDAARHIEMFDHHAHPFRAIDHVSITATHRQNMIDRLIKVCGLDFLDQSPEENINDIVAAAWVGMEDVLDNTPKGT